MKLPFHKNDPSFSFLLRAIRLAYFCYFWLSLKIWLTSLPSLKTGSFCVICDFLRFQAKLQGLKIDDFWGIFNIKKRLVPPVRALQTEQKSILYQSFNFFRSKVIGVFVVKNWWKTGNFPTICIIYAKLNTFFDHKYTYNFWSKEVETLM